MNSRFLAVSMSTLLVTLTLASPAPAATFKNLDAVEHKLTFVEGKERQEYILQGKQELTGVCVKVCNLYIGDDPDAYEITASEKFEIEEGQLYTVESPEVGSGPDAPQQ